MRFVQLCRRMVLEAPVKSSDGAGGFDESWVALGWIWADVRLRSGRERSGGVSETDYKFIVRAAPMGAASRPVPGQRFVEGGRKFLIESVGDADPKGKYLTCFVKEELAA